MFKVRILTPQSAIYLGLATEVVLPSKDGEISVLDFHQPIISRLCPGTINIDKKWFFDIKDGVAYLGDDELKVIVEEARK